MTRANDLTPLLKRLQLGPMAATLSERIALARRELLDHASFLEICRLEICRLKDFDWSASITMDRRLLDAAFSLKFLARHEHVLLVGPAGVGKSFLAQALGYSAVRVGHTVRFTHADDFFRAMSQARMDNSVDRTFRPFQAPDLLIWTTWDCSGSPRSSQPNSTTSTATTPAYRNGPARPAATSTTAPPCATSSPSPSPR